MSKYAWEREQYAYCHKMVIMIRFFQLCRSGKRIGGLWFGKKGGSELPDHAKLKQNKEGKYRLRMVTI